MTRAVFFIPILALAACGQGEQTESPQENFIPLQKDFAGFRAWTTIDLGVQPADTVHPEGRRLLYLNQAPPHGSERFPVGTIIVKTVEKDAQAPSTFAMAKRGGTYNAQGAVGWEWFELQEGSDTTPLIVWRGITPPVGEGYGGDIVGGSCNGCHGSHVANDYVASTALLLAGF